MVINQVSKSWDNPPNTLFVVFCFHNFKHLGFGLKIPSKTLCYYWWFRNLANQLRLVAYPIIYLVLASRISSINSISIFEVWKSTSVCNPSNWDIKTQLTNMIPRAKCIRAKNTSANCKAFSFCMSEKLCQTKEKGGSKNRGTTKWMVYNGKP